MARPLRIQYPGAWYHVMNRGGGRRQVFQNDHDYLAFLTLLNEASQMWKMEVHAYCLMPNHYHLLLHTPLANLSRMMRHINGVYTQRFNLRWQRDAHLFRGRYKAILVEDEGYLDELTRYIHLNPVKAKLVEVPEQYRWSSYPYYLGRGGRPDCLITETILARHGRRVNKARREWVAFTFEGVPEKLERLLDSARWPAVFSSALFRTWVETNFIPDRRDREIIYPVRAAPRLTLAQLCMILSSVADLPWNEIKRGQGPAAALWRKLAVLAMRRELGLSWAVGGIHPSQISRLVHRERPALVRGQHWLQLVTECRSAKVKT
ncbi:MAG: transposase [Deltaproteobacteria bacterium]|nr:transposase [Deltaproteobacteria bacterium]